MSLKRDPMPRADKSIPGGLLFMWGVFPSFRFRVLIAASQKKTRFQHLKNRKNRKYL
jgi:hypothetical protein